MNTERVDRTEEVSTATDIKKELTTGKFGRPGDESGRKKIEYLRYPGLINAERVNRSERMSFDVILPKNCVVWLVQESSTGHVLVWPINSAFEILFKNRFFKQRNRVVI